MTQHTETGRSRLVAEAEHSGKMEGLTVTTTTKADAAKYVAGEFTTDELIDRARRRYGLD
ncbi:hypothetical protein [Aeromicrobium alkaliterrae]|uniref:Antitoxin VbhA domain-containing protein n=1 Tax=Aeromicrobium alkaliterrae TaxID=302168 RepID=A0ABN2KDM1_9ACTN